MNEQYMVIDIAGTIERLHLPEAMIQNLIKKTLDSDMLENANQAFLAGDLAQAQQAIHTIKGTAANVGLAGLSQLALEIELKIKENQYLDFTLFKVMQEVWSTLKNNNS